MTLILNKSQENANSCGCFKAETENLDLILLKVRTEEDRELKPSRYYNKVLSTSMYTDTMLILYAP